METAAPARLFDALDRRTFIKTCVTAAAAAGISGTVTARIARAVSSPGRPPVVWLHFQECTGCTETLLRTTQPSVRTLLLELISLDYHETLCAAAGHQFEALLEETLRDHAGKFLLIVEGAIPVKDGGIYCQIAGRTALDLVTDVAKSAAAVIAIGSCASFGGIAASPPNPTGATGVPEILKDRTVLTLPGCPPNAYNLLGSVVHYLTYEKLPQLDAKGRPLFAYGRTVHEVCPRRSHFDAGRFAKRFGDEGHRQGWCLYELGCKGPQTYANCATNHFCEVMGAWPIGIGHPCAGCAEADIAFRVPMHDTIEIKNPTPSDRHAPVTPIERSNISPLATGVAGLVGGVLIGASVLAARRLHRVKGEEDQS